jgi:hypothetical protein
MTSGKVVAQIIEPISLTCALKEFCDYAQSEWVASDTGQMLTQQVGSSAEVTDCSGAYHSMASSNPGSTLTGCRKRHEILLVDERAMSRTCGS